MNAESEFRSKKVLVTGGSKGIGHMLATEFARYGAEVVIVASGDTVEEAAAAAAEASGGDVSGMRCDITDRTAVAALADQVGELDVLVNNAGVAFPTPVSADGMEVAELFARTVDVNLNGAFNVTKAFAPRLVDGSGRVIFTGSILSVSVVPEMSAYAASKHGLLGLAKSLSLELGARGITVNSVLPGSVATETNVKNLTGEFLDALTAKMCLNPGLLPPSKLSGIFLFLASEAASEITGQAIAVDRGQLLG